MIFSNLQMEIELILDLFELQTNIVMEPTF